MNRQTRATLSAGVSLVLGVGAVVLLGGNTAARAAGTATYSCPAPIVGPQDSTTTYDTDLPASVPAGSGPLPVAVTSSGVAKASATGQAWSLLGARKMTAITDIPILIGTGSAAVKKTAHMTGPTVPINNGGDTTLTASGTWGTWTPPAEPGSIEVSMDTSYYTSVHLLKDNGSHTSMSPQNTTCTVKGGQSRVIDTVHVTATTTTAASVVADTLTEGDSLEVSADVTTSAGKAAGKVEFKVGDGPNQKLLVNVANGKAAGVMTGLEAGTYTLTATFVPTQPAIYLASTSGETVVTVNPQVPATPTTTTLALERSSLTSDEEGKATVTVASAAGTPAGQARVVLNGKPYAADLVNGTATVTLPAQRAGTYPVTASFVPARPKEFAPSTSAPATLVVTPGAGGDLQETSTFVSFEKTSWPVGATAAVTAQVTTTQGAPAGRVDFEFAGKKVSAPVINGRAVVSLPYLQAGTYRLTAQFVPASGFEASTADPVAFSVTVPAPTPPVVAPAVASTLRLQAPSTAAVGTSATLRATVTTTDGSPAAGAVQFRWGSTTLQAPVRAGVAAVALPIRSTGFGVVTATFVPSNSARQRASLGSATLTGTKARSRTTLTARAKARVVTVRVRTTTTGQACRGQVRVTLTRGRTTTRATARTSCAGRATVRVKVRSAGTHRVSATWAGTASSTGSSAKGRVRVR